MLFSFNNKGIGSVLGGKNRGLDLSQLFAHQIMFFSIFLCR